MSNTVSNLHRDFPTARDVQDHPDEQSYEYRLDSSHGAEEEWVWPADRRWRPVAAIIGAVVALGAVATAVIINGGDSASTKATVGAPTPQTAVSTTRQPTAQPRTPPSASTATVPSPSPNQRHPETVTTVTQPSASPSAAAPRIPTAAPPPVAAPPRATLHPRTVVYSVTGTKQLLDLVNVVYTDARGFPVTDFNVSLPWTKMVVLNPGVQTRSVVATSIYGRLNCSIVNAEGQTVVAAANNTIIATCTR
ncbi:hypothetical protein [Mycobacterium sp.]|uniref:hypothetical protein n=1 Tax=Mycobacterium sp. TaxID=1785 RepID=UPI003BAB5062